MSHIRVAALAFVVSVVWLSQSAMAQPLGTFRWQLQPFCNVLTVSVIQQGGIYTLDGTDNLCGAAQAASVVGVAFLNPDGTAGFGLTTVVPGGIPVHTEATINVASLSGTWRDSAGNSGAFVFTPGSPTGGPVRPTPANTIPPGSITSTELAPGAVGPAQLAPGAVGPTQLAGNSVSGANVADGSLTSADIGDAPRAAFAPDPLNNPTHLTTALGPVVVQSVTITAPAAGKVIANSSGYFNFVGAGPAVDRARCSITSGTTIDGTHLSISAGTAAGNNYAAYAATRGFLVNTAVSLTVNLVCDAFAGIVDMHDPNLIAVFVPGP